MIKTAFASVRDAFAFLESFTNFEKRAFSLRNFRLDRMDHLLGLFGSPHRGMRYFHVAGSKGKGSTAAFIASVLRRHGLRTGLYTSPHLVSYKERITLAGEEIEDRVFLRNIERIRDLLERFDPAGFPGGEHPTTFELLTCLGFLVFQELGCPWAVLETGLGGRLDATNVVTPQASVLTPIELEHTEFLGDTIPAIAREKAGIIKPGVPVFSSAQPPEALDVFRRRAAETGSPFHYLPREAEIRHCRTGRDGTRFRISWKTPGSDPAAPPPEGDSFPVFLRLLGEVQAENAALAAAAVRSVFPDLSPPVLARGLEEAFIPGRFQRLEEEPPIYVDGSHTPMSARRLLDSFLQLHPDPDTLILGIVAGKRYQEIAQILCPRFRSVLVTTPGTFKSSEPERLLTACLRHNPRSRLVPDAGKALETARRECRGGAILITGSFYLAGEILGRCSARRF